MEPNPFNPSTSARFTLASSQRVALDVYDVRGARVRALVSSFLPAGSHRVAWDGRDDAGRSAASGVYFIRFVTTDRRQTMKVMLLK